MPKTYYLHNLTRDPTKRDARKQLVGPERSRKNLFLGGGMLRVMRGRPLPIREDIYKKLQREIEALVAKGLMKVTTTGDVDGKKKEPEAPKAAPPPKPELKPEPPPPEPELEPMKVEEPPPPPPVEEVVAEKPWFKKTSRRRK